MDELENIAIICKAVIEDPETHIESLSLLQKSFDFKDWDYRSALFLSLTKVFKHIVPFYKIRTLKGKVKFGTEEDFVSAHDKKLLKEYNYFINKIISFDNRITYECASHLFSSLFYFNSSDKLITKLLKGSLVPENDYSSVFIKVIENDKEEEIIEKLTNQMIDLKFNPSILKILLEMKEIKTKKVFDNIFRIYFSVLKEEKNEFFYFTFLGLKKYKEKIEDKFKEGLFLLLDNVVYKGNIINRLECIDSILSIYGEKDYDFKIVINSLFQMIIPFKYYFTEKEAVFFCELVRKMFFMRRQNEIRSRNFVIRLMQYSLTKFISLFNNLIDEFILGYQIDLSDNLLQCNYDYYSEEIDFINEKVVYEYQLYKKIFKLEK